MEVCPACVGMPELFATYDLCVDVCRGVSPINPGEAFRTNERFYVQPDCDLLIGLGDDTAHIKFQTCNGDIVRGDGRFDLQGGWSVFGSPSAQ